MSVFKKKDGEEQKGEKKAKRIRRPNRPLLVLMCLITAIVIALNVAIIGIAAPYLDLLDTVLTGEVETDQTVAANEAGEAITEEVESEAIVLLENNDSTLPLASSTKVNVFGAGVVNFCFGGTGSGSGDSSENVTLIEGMEQAGLEVNEELTTFLEENISTTEDMGLVGTDFGVYEPDVSIYTDDVIASAQEFSDVAVVVISRQGGEGEDLPTDMADYTGGTAGRSYLELTENEEDLLALVEESFGTVIVLVNSTNAMELGFLEDEAIDVALWVGVPGSTGCNAIGDVLVGLVNPSGHTVDTFAYAVESAPSYYSIGDFDYTNAYYTNESLFGATGTGDALTGDDTYHYTEYLEGIYVGYRYYETAAEDGFIDYDSTVQYPFGYGLSYTTFEKSITGFEDDGETISVEVTVTNTGDVAGKDVVQIYYSAPYYEGGIEKSSVVLGAYDKTDELEPGESQTLTLEFTYEDMASYDYLGIKAEGGAYVLEAGEYTISLRENSHDVIDTRTVTVDADVIYNDENDGARSTDEVAATNQFDAVSFGADVTYLSRADWEGTFPTEVLSDTEATDEMIAAIEGESLDVLYDLDGVEDITYANNGLTLADMVGLDYDDPQWDLLLEQLSLSDMELLVGNGGWGTVALSSVGKPYLSDSDGPNGVNHILSGATGNQYTAQSMLGYTWNAELAERVGECMGDEFVSYGISGAYAPGCNIHRSPFSGRNYEYVSEDSLLTGTIVASEIQGIQSKGVYCYVKHFALNDQETNRDNGGLVTWANEQSIREIYLKAFEIAVKDGEALGVMSSFNRIGATPAAESYALLTTVLRDEWGFEGAVITDCVMACDTEDINRALLAGNDLQLNLLANTMLDESITDTAAGHQALRQACHNILYMIVASGCLDYADTGLSGVATTLIAIDVVVIALLVLYFVRRHIKLNRWRDQEGIVKGKKANKAQTESAQE